MQRHSRVYCKQGWRVTLSCLLFHIVEKMGLTVDEVDKLTGPVLGRPKSATFRTCDVVGLDTLVKVAKDVYDRCPDDSARETF